MGQALLAAAATAALTAAARAEIDRSQLFTHPVPPAKEALDRLNLVMAWRTYVPVDGRRDGIDSVHMAGSDILVQTRAGLVAAIDAETGRTRWRTPVGVPYRSRHMLAFNSRYVFPINNTFLYCIDRRDGVIRWRFRLIGASSAPPVADDEQVYVVRPDGRVFAFAIPRLDIPWAVPVGGPGSRSLAEQTQETISPLYQGTLRAMPAIGHLTTIRETGEEVETGPLPQRAWDYMTSLRIQDPPLQARDYLLLQTPDGKLVALAKKARSDGTTAEIFDFAVDGPINVRSGYMEDMAYIGSEDTNLYALMITNGRVRWRFTAGAPITQSPAVTADDVFVTAGRLGMARLRRENGEPMWRIPIYQGRGQSVVSETNAEADRMLAANPKFVYAFDRVDRLLVLDYRRGITLARLDTREFVFPVTNESTDRLYLAANNGLIVCLHDREYTEPIRYRKSEEGGSEVVRQKLEQLITQPGVEKPIALRDVLDGFRISYGLRFFIDLPAFREAGIENPEIKGIILPKVQNKPLGEFLKEILAQAQAGYRIVDDIVLIIPNKRKAE